MPLLFIYEYKQNLFWQIIVVVINVNIAVVIDHSCAFIIFIIIRGIFMPNTPAWCLRKSTLGILFFYQ